MTEGNGARERGRAIQERFDALGYGYREFEELTGVGRKTLRRAMDGLSTNTTYTSIETWLDRLEARAQGKPVEQPKGVPETEAHEGVVRIRLEGVFGAEAAIVEAPVDNPDALAAALDIIMRRLNKGEGETES